MLNEFDAVGCISHNIDIYKDAVRYYVFKPTIRGGRIGLPNTLVAEEFHTITEEEFQSVLDTVRALELHQEELYEEPPSPSPDKYVNRNNYFTNRQDDFLRIKASVEQVARLTGWNCPPRNAVVFYWRRLHIGAAALRVWRAAQEVKADRSDKTIK